jgi:hypothetical protein
VANECVAPNLIGSLFRETSMGNDPSVQVCRVGDLVGLSFPKLATSGYTGVFQIPTGTLTTGLTFTLATVDDGTDASDLGKVVRFGVTIKRLVDAETIDIDSGAGTEQTVDVTLETTAGNITVNTLAIANANLDSAAVGNLVQIRVRRVSTATQDTCNGRVVLVGLGVVGT